MEDQPQHRMGLLPTISLVTGNLIGSGVFLLPATLAAFGTVSLFGWIATSIGAILLSLVFAQLSSKTPKIGGPHTYVYKAFGETAAFYVAWGYWILSWISNAALVVAAVGYASSIFGGLDLWVSVSLQIIILLIVAMINLQGVEIAGEVELGITVLKLLPLVIVPIVGLFFIDFSHFFPLNRTLQSLPSTVNAVALLTLWGFIGLETGTVPGSDVVNPKRTIPLATIIGTLIAAFVYILGTFTIMGVVPPEQLAQSKAPYADVASIIFGGSWGVPIAIAAIISCLGALNGWTMVVGRIALGAARDGLFPSIFGHTTKAGAPKTGVIISTACSIPFIIMSMNSSLLTQFNFIIDISVTLVLFIYMICVLAYLYTNWKDQELTFWKTMLGIAALAFSFWALWAASLKMVMYSLVIAGIGFPLRLWMRRNSTQPHPACVIS